MDHILLNSNNHHSNLVNSLDHFKAVNSFVDVTLVCEGHTVKAHKIILAAGSNVLHRLMLANPAKHPIIILTETKYDYLRMIIDFLYNGRVEVPRNDLKKLLAIAVTFEMNELKRLCEENINNQRAVSELNSHPCSKSPDLSRSSPKKKRQRRQSSDSDILYDPISPKREISFSPYTLEQPEVSSLTDTSPAVAQIESLGFNPQIADSRSINESSKESSTGNDITVTCVQNNQKKNASTECDIQPRKELEILKNFVPIQPARNILRPRYNEKSGKPTYNEKSDDSESDTRNKSYIRKRTSKVWKFFTAVNNRYAVCKICMHKLSYRTTVTNLTKHLRKKHPRFDPYNPPAKLPEVPMLRVQNDQLEMFEEIDFNSVEEEVVIEDGEQLQYEVDLDEGIPSTSTPCILKIT